MEVARSRIMPTFTKPQTTTAAAAASPHGTALNSKYNKTKTKMKTFYLSRNATCKWGRRLLALLPMAMLALLASAQELYVGTYNIRNNNSGDTNAGNGWATRKTYLFNMVNFQQPDLLGVQEALHDQVVDMQNGLDGYGYIGVGRDDGVESGEYAAIFYRKARMALLDYGDFWLSDTPEKPSKGFVNEGGSGKFYRIVTWGKFLDKETQSLVYHFNTHMDLDETNRQQSYYLIKKKIHEIAGDDAPVIVSGDFNAEQTSGAYKLFYNSGFLYDCHTVCKQRFITNGTAGNFNASILTQLSTGELRRIDHLFVTDNFDVEHYGVLTSCYYSTSGSASYATRMYSDHFPVMAKLTITKKQESDVTSELPPLVDGVYQLSTADDLVAFGRLVNGLNGYMQDTAAKGVLTGDIDMSGVSSWRPIGSNSSPYEGTFDGQGHTIKNLNVNTGSGLSGLFGKTLRATVRNFSITGRLTVADGTVDHGVVGYASASKIDHVYSALDITVPTANTNTKHVGGIVGTQGDATTVTCCVFSGTISDAGSDTVGGIAGYANQTNNSITYCINGGTITSGGSTTNTGGILGYVNYEGFKMSNCANAGTVSAASTTYGGQILGRQMRAMNVVPSVLYHRADGSLAAFGTGTHSSSSKGATEKTQEEFRNGAVAILLNSGQSNDNCLFRQNLEGCSDIDAYPVPNADHQVVYQGQFGKRSSRSDTANYNFYVNSDGRLSRLALLNLFATPVAFTAAQATYSRTSTGEWNTLYLPYRVESGNGIQFYRLTEVKETGELKVVESDVLEAYTPGLFKFTGDGFTANAYEAYIAVPPEEKVWDTGVGSLTLTGTLGATTLAAGSYYLSGDRFVRASAPTSLGAFEAYLDGEELTTEELTIFIDDGTGIAIVAPTGETAKGAAYDLQGRRVASASLPKGIYIVGGKKVVVR